MTNQTVHMVLKEFGDPKKNNMILLFGDPKETFKVKHELFVLFNCLHFPISGEAKKWVNRLELKTIDSINTFRRILNNNSDTDTLLPLNYIKSLDNKNTDLDVLIVVDDIKYQSEYDVLFKKYNVKSIKCCDNPDSYVSRHLRTHNPEFVYTNMDIRTQLANILGQKAKVEPKQQKPDNPETHNFKVTSYRRCNRYIVFSLIDIDDDDEGYLFRYQYDKFEKNLHKYYEFDTLDFDRKFIIFHKDNKKYIEYYKKLPINQLWDDV